MEQGNGDSPVATWSQENGSLTAYVVRQEKSGATISPHDVRLIGIVDDIRPQTKQHYTHVSFELADPKWDAKLMEPDKCAEWRYFAVDALPSNLFSGHVGVIKQYLAEELYMY